MMIDKKSLLDVLCDKNSFEYFKTKSDDEIYKLFGKELSETIGFEQNNPHHCYNLFDHLLHTLEALKDGMDIINDEKRLLLVAGLFHDVAKVKVAALKDGKYTFYGHAQKTAKWIRPVLENIGFDVTEIQKICFYIKHHDDFIQFSLPNNMVANNNHIEINDVNVRKYIKRVKDKEGCGTWIHNKEVWINLVDLCCADAKAQADVIVWENKVIDTKRNKLQKLDLIRSFIEKGANY